MAPQTQKGKYRMASPPGRHQFSGSMTAGAPLRRTKVLSLFPRFFVKSELEDAIELAFEGSEVSVHMEPGDLVPVHPPNDRERLFFRSQGVTSQAFAFKGARGTHGLDGVERCRTFHVSRDRQNSNTNSELSFVQVDVQKTTFPAKNHVPLTEGYFLVLRKGDFRCAEDLLFHFDNQTPHSFFATISGLQSMPMASQKLLILTSGSQLWQHLVGFQDPEQCLKVHVKLCRDNRALRDDRSSRELVSQNLGHAVTSRLHAKPFALEASLRLSHAWYDHPPDSAEDSMDCMDDTGPYRLGRLAVNGWCGVVDKSKKRELVFRLMPFPEPQTHKSPMQPQKRQRETTSGTTPPDECVFVFVQLVTLRHDIPAMPSAK
eukprot:s2370_g1.t1